MKKILCVDDIQTNLFTLDTLFESNAEGMYEIITALSGREALAILLTTKIDLILLDVMMPELDGFETAELILKNKKTKNIPIIYLTAKVDDETISKCYAVGGVDYMSKPFNIQELLLRVKFHLELVENRKAVNDEKRLLQDILDIQENLVIVMNAKEVIKINEATKNFYDVKTIEELIEKYACICSSFLKEEGTFYIYEEKKDEFWLDTLAQELLIHDVKVNIRNVSTSEKSSFDIRLKKFGTNYILSLTNIHNMKLKNEGEK